MNATADPALTFRKITSVDEGVSRRNIFDFLGLPRELRDMIYKEMIPGHLSHQDKTLLVESPISLLFTNKQIYAEFQDIVNEATYSLTFCICAPNCACRRRWGEFDSKAAKQEPDPDLEIEVHSTSPGAVIAHKHRKALAQFKNVEIVFDVSKTVGFEIGLTCIPRIIRSIAPALRQRSGRPSKARGQHDHSLDVQE